MSYYQDTPEVLIIPYGADSMLPVAHHPVATRPHPLPPNQPLNEGDRANLALIFSASTHPHITLKARAITAGANVAIGWDELELIDLYIAAWEQAYFSEAVDSESAMAMGVAPLHRYLYLFQLRENVRVAHLPYAPILESDFLARLRNLWLLPI